MFLHFQLPAGGLEQGLLYEAIGLSAVVATVVGVRLFQPSYRTSTQRLPDLDRAARPGPVGS